MALALVVSPVSIKWDWIWRDTDRGGHDWALWRVKPDTVLPVGYGFIGDSWVMQPSPWDNIPDYGQVVIRTDKPEFAKPCTGYKLVYTMPYTKYEGSPKMYMPTHTDPNYIGIAIAVMHYNDGNNPPPIGKYYCIHKAFLNPGKGNPIPDGGNHLKDTVNYLYQPIDGTGNMSFEPITYTIRTEAQVWNICSGITPDSTLSTTGSDCLSYMKDRCGPEDIKIGGRCSTWCESDAGKLACDAVKKTFCSQHPESSWCDCTLATTRPAYKDEIKIYADKFMNAAPRPCTTKLCRNAQEGIDQFVLSRDTDLLKSCPAIQYIDQSVNVDGSGNTVNANQRAEITGSQQNSSDVKTAANTTTNATTTTIAKLTSSPILLILFILVICAILYFVFFDGDDDTDTENPTQSETPVQSPVQSE